MRRIDPHPDTTPPSTESFLLGLFLGVVFGMVLSVFFFGMLSGV